jgi:hypothetical protein
MVSHAAGSLLVATARGAGLSRELSARLGPWRRPWAIHDPGKIVLDLAVAVALGGDCAADVAVVRAQPGVFGLVASDPTVSRLVATLAGMSRRRWARSPRPGQWPGSGCGGRAGAPVQDGTDTPQDQPARSKITLRLA